MESDNNNSKIMEACWRAGARNFTALKMNKFEQHLQISNLNVVSTCKELRHVVEQSVGRSTKSSDIIVPFRDLAQMTFGLTFILNQKVSKLLDDTLHLFKQVNCTPFNFTDPLASQAESTFHSRKRKRITTITVSKRTRVEIFSQSTAVYYNDLLNDPEQWKSTTPIVEEHYSKEVCSRQDIYIETTEQLTVNEDEDLLLEQGFGDERIVDLALYSDLFTRHNTHKRKSLSPPDLMGTLYGKVPKLDEVLPVTNSETNEVLPVTNSETNEVLPVTNFLESNEIETPSDNTVISPIPHVETAVEIVGKPKLKRNSKLIIDQQTINPREVLIKNISSYKTKQKTSIVQIPRKSVTTMLTSFKHDWLYPDVLNKTVASSPENMLLDCEQTLRAIMQENYSCELKDDILKTTKRRPKPQAIQELIEQPILVENNNNYPIIGNTETPDSFDLMTNLLNNWRNNPDKEAINTNELFKFCKNRKEAAATFAQLIDLSHHGFINITTHPNDVRIKDVTMGPLSMQLINNFQSPH